MGTSLHRVVPQANRQISRVDRRSSLNRDKVPRRLVHPVHKGSSKVSSSRPVNSYPGVPMGEVLLVLLWAEGPGEWISWGTQFCSPTQTSPLET